MLSAETDRLQHIGLASATNAQHVRVRVVSKNGLEELIEGVIGVTAQQYSLLARVHNVAGKVHPCESCPCLCIVLSKKLECQSARCDEVPIYTNEIDRNTNQIMQTAQTWWSSDQRHTMRH